MIAALLLWTTLPVAAQQQKPRRRTSPYKYIVTPHNGVICEEEMTATFTDQPERGRIRIGQWVDERHGRLWIGCRVWIGWWYER